MNRRAVFVSLTISAVVLTPLGVAAATDRSPRATAPNHAATGPTPGDGDHDQVSDDFEARLAGAKAGDRLKVIVTGVTAAKAQRAVGTFRVGLRLGLIDGFAATMTAGQARALARTPGVRRVEADGRMQALDDGTNSDFGATLARSDPPGLDGSGVGLCVVDTGVDPNHEQIAGRTVVFKDVINARTTPYDDHGHGTHVMAIAAGDGTGGAQAATFVGVAPAADLYSAKVLDSTGYGSDSQVIAGIQWCAAQPGVDVISMSLGDPIGGNGTDAVSVAVNNAVSGGVTTVVAGGNSGDQPETINAPGVAAGALTVGAVSDWSAPAGTERHDDGIWLAAFSSRGPTSDGRTKPDISGPGYSVTSAQGGTVGGYVTMSGTSMATPYVAGAVVLAKEAAPAASPAQLRAAMTSSAVDVGAVGADNEWGAGLIDVRAFVDAARGLSPLRRTPTPTHTHVTGTVPQNGGVTIPITVPADGVGIPLAVTATLGGEAICFFGCLFVEWSPDMDLELVNPGGAVIARSECALDGLSCGVGRQETIGIVPTTAGTYTLRVYAFTGDPNNGKGGPFAVDISRGPLVTTATPPPPPPPGNLAPVARAGSDQTVHRTSKGKATFTLDGGSSSDPDGTITAYRWTLGGTTVGSTARVTLSKGLGTYVYTLTVTDNGGATATDTVTVTVIR